MKMIVTNSDNFFNKSTGLLVAHIKIMNAKLFTEFTIFELTVLQGLS